VFGEFKHGKKQIAHSGVSQPKLCKELHFKSYSEKAFYLADKFSEIKETYNLNETLHKSVI